jgi:DNA-binding NtrC family response regulator
MKTNLLLVEDDDAVHCALAEVLEGEGYEVLHAFGPADALLATQVNGDIGLVLLDLNLGGKNGWDVFESLTRGNPMLPVIIITARSDQRALAEAAGVGALMEKPLNIPRLLELIARLIAERPAERIARLAGRAPCTLYSEAREHRSQT